MGGKKTYETIFLQQQLKMTERTSRQLTYELNVCNNSDDGAVVVRIIEDVQHCDTFTLFSL